MDLFVFSISSLYPDIFKNETEQRRKTHEVSVLQNQNGRQLEMPPIRFSQIKKKNLAAQTRLQNVFFLLLLEWHMMKMSNPGGQSCVRAHLSILQDRENGDIFTPLPH